MIEPWLITFACVSAVHLGMSDAVKMVTRTDLPIIGCVKCFTFWSVLAWCVITRHGIVYSIALSMLTAWAAIWLDLLLCASDALYLRIYDKLNDNPQGTAPAQHDKTPFADNEKDTLPKL